jgi:heme/copper-type cytochrome/quinol oxidase subunit 2
MNRRQFMAAIGLLTASAATRAQVEKVFDITLVDGKPVGEQTLRVAKGEKVMLRWKSDRPMSLHLHGYEIEAAVAPGRPTDMRFTASMPGRFPVHGSTHRAVLYVEVQP